MLSPAQAEVKRFEPYRYSEIVAVADGDDDLIEQQCQALVDQWENDAINEREYFDQDDLWFYLR